MQISCIGNLNHLLELQVLNLAGNQICHVSALTSMHLLAELNFQQNKIHAVVEVDTLPNLQRLFLSYNEIGRTNKKSTAVLNNLADFEGDTLTLYGPQSLEALDKNWVVQAAGAVVAIVFKFIDFEEISKHLHKVSARFPATQLLVFSAANSCSFQQINMLTNVRRLDNLTIDYDSNPITNFILWEHYILF